MCEYNAKFSSKEEGATSFGYAVYAVDDSNKYQRETFELCDGQINVPHPSWAENVSDMD